MLKETPSFDPETGNESYSSQEIRRLVDQKKISEKEALELYHRVLEKREREATIDDLTETLNKRGFREKLHQVVESLRDPEQSQTAPHSVLIGIIDLNLLKKINDTFGHQAGDQAIKTLAQALKNHLRDPDTIALIQENSDTNEQKVARQGGDEFAVIIPIYSNDPHASSKIIARLESLLTNLPMSFQDEEGHNLVLNAASGFAELTRHDKDISEEELIEAADEIMYQRKSEIKTASQ